MNEQEEKERAVLSLKNYLTGNNGIGSLQNASISQNPCYRVILNVNNHFFSHILCVNVFQVVNRR